MLKSINEDELNSWILMLKSITLGLVWTHFDEDELNSCQIKIVICETNIWD